MSYTVSFGQMKGSEVFTEIIPTCWPALASEVARKQVKRKQLPKPSWTVINEITKWQSYLSLVPSIANRSQGIKKKKKKANVPELLFPKHLAKTSGMEQHYLTRALMMEDSVFTTWKCEAERQGKRGSW